MASSKGVKSISIKQFANKKFAIEYDFGYNIKYLDVDDSSSFYLWEKNTSHFQCCLISTEVTAQLYLKRAKLEYYYGIPWSVCPSTDYSMIEKDRPNIYI